MYNTSSMKSSIIYIIDWCSPKSLNCIQFSQDFLTRHQIILYEHSTHQKNIRMISLQHTTNQRQHTLDLEILIQLELLLNKKNNLHFTKQNVLWTQLDQLRGIIRCSSYHPLIRLHICFFVSHCLWFHSKNGIVRLLFVMLILPSDKSHSTLHADVY